MTHFRTFSFYWRSTARHSSAAIAAFDEVDRLRQQLGPQTLAHESNTAAVHKLARADFQHVQGTRGAHDPATLRGEMGST